MLFLDDGISFNYLDGDYSLRRFIFSYSEGLTSELFDKPGLSTYENIVERIVFYGFERLVKKISLINQIHNVKTSKSVEFIQDIKSNMLIIRKPWFNISKSFHLKIDY